MQYDTPGINCCGWCFTATVAQVRCGTPSSPSSSFANSTSSSSPLAITHHWATFLLLVLLRSTYLPKFLCFFSFCPSTRRLVSAMPATTAETLSLVTKNVTVAPLVLLSVADHYGRTAKGTRKRVVGVLLGENSGQTVRVSNSFAGASCVLFPPFNCSILTYFAFTISSIRGR